MNKSNPDVPSIDARIDSFTTKYRTKKLKLDEAYIAKKHKLGDLWTGDCSVSQPDGIWFADRCLSKLERKSKRDLTSMAQQFLVETMNAPNCKGSNKYKVAVKKFIECLDTCTDDKRYLTASEKNIVCQTVNLLILARSDRIKVEIERKYEREKAEDLRLTRQREFLNSYKLIAAKQAHDNNLSTEACRLPMQNCTIC